MVARNSWIERRTSELKRSRGMITITGVIDRNIGGGFSLANTAVITSSTVDRGIQSFIQGVGWFYLLCALSAILIKPAKGERVCVLLCGANTTAVSFER